MAPLRYSPLSEGRAIRVLELTPGGSDSAFEGELVQVDLDDNPEYSALSYVWGTDMDSIPFECDGCRTEVTKNLAEALRHLQHESEARALWIDALCINQQDVEEKNHQVALMKDIYASANKVVVWLGPDEEEAAPEVFEDIKSTLKSLEEAIDSYADLNNAEWFHSGRPSPSLSKIALLFGRQYFTRTWVIQEIGLTNRAIAHWGQSKTNFNEIGLIAMFYLKYFRPELEALGCLGDAERVSNVYLTYLPQPGSHRLPDVLHRGRLNQATDARDKVYAFISHPSARERASDYPYIGDDRLSREDLTEEDIKWRTLSVILTPSGKTWQYTLLDHVRNESLRPPSPDAVITRRLLHDNPGQSITVPRYWPGSSFIKPDYNKSVVSVYRDLTIKMIERFESLEVLSYIQHTAPFPPNGPDFPSWIPRWDLYPATSILGRVDCDHTASANRRPVITPSPDLGCLTVRGLFFDRVALHTIPLTREDFTSPSKPGPIFSMSSRCGVHTHPIQDYPRIYVPGIPMMQDPDRLKAYRKTWTAGRTPGTLDAPRDGYNPDIDFAAYQLRRFREQPQDESISDILTRIIELVGEGGRHGKADRFAEVAGAACHGRCFFITKGGFFGIGPSIIEEEDPVVILLGADVPFVLREKRKCGVEKEGHVVVGECYVHGLMTGDAVRAWGGLDGDLKDITLW
jgi:hypothetical protein